jgi:hypothetical protein
LLTNVLDSLCTASGFKDLRVTSGVFVDECCKECPLISALVEHTASDTYAAIRPALAAVMTPLFRYMLDRAKIVAELLKKDDTAAACAGGISNAYRPFDGIAYYFREDGLPSRDVVSVKGLDVSGPSSKAHVGECTKNYAVPGGAAYVMYFLCPLHNHCWGKISSLCCVFLTL